LLDDGFRIALVDVVEPEAEHLAETGAVFVQADLTDLTAAGGAIHRAAELLGGLTALVNNAGICPLTPVPDVTPDEWRRVLDINLGAAFFAAQAALKLLPPGGAIVNVSSYSGHRGGIVVGAHYASSKAGLLGLTKTLALAALAQGVRVNAVAPGPIETAMTAAWPQDALEKARAGVPIGRLIERQEVADAVRFLLSDEARAITGATLDVDGGMALR
jgi:3-oxoacyl-[acyl-carrier protein] reductase